MKEFKGTPGPWLASHHYSDVVTVIDSQGLEVVTAEHCPIMQNYDERLGIDHWADDARAFRELPEHEQAANAYLIAAAPDLLEALQTIQAKMSDFIKLANEVGINDADGFYLAAAADAEVKARAAISKALGEG
ncbi:TPA: hypothetical protein L3I95_003684 [Enterobacter cloacae]|nr:hypothetical protein [Enterobacter cloacae]